MTYKFSLSDIAIAVFAVILVSTFSLQLHLNRSFTSKVLAQTYQIMCGNTVMPPGTVVVCTPGQTTTQGADVYKCNDTCTGWVLKPPDNIIQDRGACCTDNGIQSTCNDTYTSSTCATGTATLPAGVKWFDSRNGCYSARTSNGGKCIAVISSSSSAASFGISSSGITSSTSSIAFNPSVCGDSKVDKPNGQGVSEDCDWGPRNSDTLADSCRSNCKNPRCGDGIVDASLEEECDDGALGNGAEGWGSCDAYCHTSAPAEPESLYFMITQALMGLGSFETLSTVGASSSSGGASLINWEAIFLPVNPLSW